MASCAGTQNSDRRGALSWLAWWLPLCGGIALGACSASPAAPRSVACTGTTIVSGTPEKDAETPAALQRSVESGPLYDAAAASSGIAACRIRRDQDALVLEYRFGNGATLRVERDARLEYTDTAAGFASPPSEPVVDILMRAERAAFGTAGCGIDWEHPETQAADAKPGMAESVYRGDTCNCQARIRRDATGRVVALALRSAC